jgi:hypothetical protein
MGLECLDGVSRRDIIDHELLDTLRYSSTSMGLGLRGETHRSQASVVIGVRMSNSSDGVF